MLALNHSFGLDIIEPGLVTVFWDTLLVWGQIMLGWDLEPLKVGLGQVKARIGQVNIE